MSLRFLTPEEREKLRQEDPETYAQLAAEYLPQPSQMIRATNGIRSAVERNSPMTWTNGRRPKND
jgi:hypothetical protein